MKVLTAQCLIAFANGSESLILNYCWISKNKMSRKLHISKNIFFFGYLFEIRMDGLQVVNQVKILSMLLHTSVNLVQSAEL